jgi:hypothetical protein
MRTRILFTKDRLPSLSKMYAVPRPSHHPDIFIHRALSPIKFMGKCGSVVRSEPSLWCWQLLYLPYCSMVELEVWAELAPLVLSSEARARGWHWQHYSHHPVSGTPPLSGTNQFPHRNSLLFPSDFLYSLNILSVAQAYQFLALSNHLKVCDCLKYVPKLGVKCWLAKFCWFKVISPLRSVITKL